MSALENRNVEMTRSAGNIIRTHGTCQVNTMIGTCEGYLFDDISKVTRGNIGVTFGKREHGLESRLDSRLIKKNTH